jgi:hypothetical protein
MTATSPKPGSPVHREAKLALLSLQAQQHVDRTDAALREVELAIDRLKSALPN